MRRGGALLPEPGVELPQRRLLRFTESGPWPLAPDRSVGVGQRVADRHQDGAGDAGASPNAAATVQVHLASRSELGQRPAGGGRELLLARRVEIIDRQVEEAQPVSRKLRLAVRRLAADVEDAADAGFRQQADAVFRRRGPERQLRRYPDQQFGRANPFPPAELQEIR